MDGNRPVTVTSLYELTESKDLALSQSTRMKSTRAEQEQVQVLFKIHGFTYEVGNIPISRIRSIQSPLPNVWISRLLVVTVSIGCLSTHASVKLYRNASHDLLINSSYYEESIPRFLHTVS